MKLQITVSAWEDNNKHIGSKTVWTTDDTLRINIDIVIELVEQLKDKLRKKQEIEDDIPF